MSERHNPVGPVASAYVEGVRDGHSDAIHWLSGVGLGQVDLDRKQFVLGLMAQFMQFSRAVEFPTDEAPRGRTA